MKRMVLVAAMMLSLGSVATAEPQRPTSDDFVMSMTISDDGKVIASPRMTIAVGAKSRVHVDKGDGRSFRMNMTFSDDEDGQIKLDSVVDATSPTLGKVHFAPSTILRPGQPVRIEYGNQTPGVRPLRIEISLDAS